MTRLALYASIASVFSFFCLNSLDAKPGKGGSKGKPSKSFAPKSNGPKFTNRGPALKPADRAPKANQQDLNGKPKLNEAGEKFVGRDKAVAVQKANEERKLLHRQSTAEKLRQISARNGNENLLNTADRMDQKALDHYEQRQSRIDELAQQGDDAPIAADELTDPLDRDFTEDELSQLEPKLANERRLLNEERKLQHQLDVAQQLRDLAARNGNQNLIRSAENMESMAASRYQQQLEKLLPVDPAVPVTAPIEPVLAP